MTILDHVLARLSKLPAERQEALALQLELLIDDEENGESLLTDEQWADVEARLNEPDETIPHEEVVAYFRDKYQK
jgi:hypothetical protein